MKNLDLETTNIAFQALTYDIHANAKFHIYRYENYQADKKTLVATFGMNLYKTLFDKESADLKIFLSVVLSDIEKQVLKAHYTADYIAREAITMMCESADRADLYNDRNWSCTDESTALVYASDIEELDDTENQICYTLV